MDGDSRSSSIFEPKIISKLACEFCARDSGLRQQTSSIPNPCASPSDIITL